MQQLCFAAAQGDLSRCKELISDDFSLLHTPDERGNMPLHCAVCYDRLEVTRYFIEELKLDPNQKCANELEMSPLILCVVQGLRKMMLYLSTHVIVSDQRDSKGNSALHYAANLGRGDMIAFLVDCGLDPNVRNALGQTPLMAATAKTHRTVMLILLKLGANVHAEDLKGQVCTHYIVSRKAMYPLLQYNASFTKRDNDGRVPCVVVAANPHSEKSLSLLVEATGWTKEHNLDILARLYTVTAKDVPNLYRNIIALLMFVSWLHFIMTLQSTFSWSGTLAMHTCFYVAVGCFWSSCLSPLATVPSHPPSPQVYQALLHSTAPICLTCRVERGTRIKHCAHCEVCVKRFDHHCDVLGRCIGASNHRQFVLFLLVFVLLQLIYATSILNYEYYHVAAHSVPRTVLVIIYIIVHGGFFGLMLHLFCTQLNAISRGLTTNELFSYDPAPATSSNTQKKGISYKRKPPIHLSNWLSFARIQAS